MILMNFRLCFTGHAESAQRCEKKPFWCYGLAALCANAELPEIDALDCLPDLPELLALPPPDGQFHTPVMFRGRLIDDVRQIARFILYSNGCPAGHTLKIFHLQDEQTSDVFQHLAFDHLYPPSLTFRSGRHELPA
jgi:hypothetical protein